MRIIINDANILIDIIKLELLNSFFELKFDLQTTDFVFEEIEYGQREELNELIGKGRLKIIETETVNDLNEIYNLKEAHNGVSIEDCSVWYYSKKLTGVLMTGDGNLRKHAKRDGVEVRGIIYIFDELLKQDLIKFPEAVSKIQNLYQLNNRLPKKEIDKRVESWKSGKLFK